MLCRCDPSQCEAGWEKLGHWEMQAHHGARSGESKWFPHSKPERILISLSLCLSRSRSFVCSSSFNGSRHAWCVVSEETIFFMLFLSFNSFYKLGEEPTEHAHIPSFFAAVLVLVHTGHACLPFPFRQLLYWLDMFSSFSLPFPFPSPLASLASKPP